MTLINRINEIGKSGVCSDKDLHLFLPNFPTLRGEEFIFNIKWTDVNRYSDDEIEHFIKGLHLIEMKYKAASHNDFGFGSPSPTFNVISKLEPKNPILAENLTAWVLENGGNYYINTKKNKP